MSKKVKVMPKAKSDVENDEMKQAIIAAYYEIQHTDAKKKQREKQAWREKIFGTAVPQPKNEILCRLLEIWSDSIGIFKVLFIKEEDVPEGLGTESLLKLVLSPAFKALKWFLYLLAGYSVYYSFANLTFWYIAVGLSCFMIARIIRIAAIEIENMKDREYLASFFSCVMSLGAIIIAIVALLKK